MGIIKSIGTRPYLSTTKAPKNRGFRLVLSYPQPSPEDKRETKKKPQKKAPKP